MNWLLLFLQDERRTLPAYVLSQADQWVRNDFVIDAEDLAERVQSVAHVIKAPYGLGYAWTPLVGRQWSSFNGAIRTFRPGFDRDADSISDHPRILEERIQRLRVGEKVGPAAVADMLEQQASLHSAGKSLDLAGCLFLEDARTRQAELARSAASESDDWRSLYEDEISALNAKIAKLGEQVDESQALADQADQERNYYSERNGDLRSSGLCLCSLRISENRLAGGSLGNRSVVPRTEIQQSLYCAACKPCVVDVAVQLIQRNAGPQFGSPYRLGVIRALRTHVCTVAAKNELEELERDSCFQLRRLL